MKKSLSAIFCLVIMLSLSVPVSASAFDSSNYASSNSSAVAQSQYEMLMDSFGFDSSLSDIYKVGSTSGYRSGTVTSTNGSVTYRINNQPLTISNVLVTDAMNLGGDSGGIVYCKSGSNYYAIGTASGSKHSTNNLTEDTFIECYVSQMLYAIQPLDCSYLPLS